MMRHSLSWNRHVQSELCSNCVICLENSKDIPSKGMEPTFVTRDLWEDLSLRVSPPKIVASPLSRISSSCGKQHYLVSPFSLLLLMSGCIQARHQL
eukprot:334306-Pelagomonas_calceolata.AAC.4